MRGLGVVPVLAAWAVMVTGCGRGGGGGGDDGGDAVAVADGMGPEAVDAFDDLAAGEVDGAGPQQDVCVPSCEGLECGDDGCGGVCGTCPGAQDECVEGQCACKPACTDTFCGDDGCGGSCGSCGPDLACDNGQCVCQPSCDGKVCGSDGCYGSCGECTGAQEECVEGACVCQPACTGKVCGEDGCGAMCGACGGAQDACVDGQCVCQPACTGKVCGDDGCGSVCGECADGDVCFDGACCTPQCQGKECGPDGCGGVCGLCPGAQDVCQQGQCVCVPDCAGKVCGPDGCGGACGLCQPGDECFLGECCTPDCTGKTCGDNLCGGFCGNGAFPTQGCPAFQDCDAGGQACALYPPPDTCAGKQCGADGLGGSCGTCPCMDCLPAATKCEGFQCIVPGALECYEIFDCFETCQSGDSPCYKACKAEGSVEAQAQYDAWFGCLTKEGFYQCPEDDKECQDAAIKQCMTPYYDCFHGDESCSALYVCLNGCFGDTTCASACFTAASIEALKTWDAYIACLDTNGYYDCLDPGCQAAAMDACKPSLLECTNGSLSCKEVFGCIKGCDPFAWQCPSGCLWQGTVEVQTAFKAVGDCVNASCFPATAQCEAEVLLTVCADVYQECLDL